MYKRKKPAAGQGVATGFGKADRLPGTPYPGYNRGENSGFIDIGPAIKKDPGKPAETSGPSHVMVPDIHHKAPGNQANNPNVRFPTGVTNVPSKGYQSPYFTQINGLYNQIANRKPFQFSVDDNALYDMLKSEYMANGQLAMKDTMGAAAGLTGGYANSNAQMVGQQAYNQYLQGLYDRIPELYQMDLQAYEMEGNRLKDQYGMLNQLDARDYQRYMDQLQQDKWQQQFDYQKGQDNIANQHWREQFEYGKGQDQQAQDRWQQQFDYQKEQDQKKWDEDLRRWGIMHSGGGGGGGGGNPGSTDNQETGENYLPDNFPWDSLMAPPPPLMEPQQWAQRKTDNTGTMSGELTLGSYAAYRKKYEEYSRLYNQQQEWLKEFAPNWLKKYGK